MTHRQPSALATRLHAWWRLVTRDERGYAAAGTAVVLAAVAVLGVLGTGASRAVTALQDGSGWLRNEATGTVTHVNGFSGRVDATVKVARPGAAFTVVQRADGAYVQDPTTHQLTRIDGSTLTATSLPGSGAAGVQVVTAPSSTDTWLVDPSTGTVQQVDPTTLAPTGPQVRLQTAVSGSVMSAGGDLWAAVPGHGEVAHVVAGSALPQLIPVGAAGDRITVVADDGGVRVVAVDATTGVTTPLAGGGSPGHLDTTGTSGSGPPASSGGSDGYAGPGSGVFAGVGGDGTVVTGQGGQVGVASSGSPMSAGPVSSPPSAPLTSAPTTPGSTTPGGLPGLPPGVDIVGVRVLGQVAYLLDAVGRQVIPYDLQTRQLEPALTLPDHALPDLVLSGGVLFVNDPAGPTALAITAAGVVTTVSKYTEATKPSAAKGGSGTGKKGSGSGSTPKAPTAPVPAPPRSAPAPAPTTAPTTPRPAGPAAATAPGAPTITSLDPGNASASAVWTAAAPHGAAITQYRILVPGQATPQTVPGTTLSATVTGLTNDQPVSIRIQAVNKVGAGPASAPRTVTPSQDVPTAPTGVTATVANQTATVSWQAATADRTPIDHYLVRLVPSDGSTTLTATTSTATATSATVGSMVYGTSYAVSVNAVLQGGRRGPPGKGSPVTAYTNPGPVQALSIDNSTPQQLVAAWSAPATDGGSPVTSYRLSIDSGTPVGTTALSYTFGGVSDGVQHRISVQAVTDHGVSAADVKLSTPPYQRHQLHLCQSTAYADIFSLVSGSSCGSNGNFRNPPGDAFLGLSEQPSSAVVVHNCQASYSGHYIERVFLGACGAGYTSFEASFYAWPTQPSDPGAHEVTEYRSSGSGGGYWYGISGQTAPAGFARTGSTFWT